MDTTIVPDEVVEEETRSPVETQGYLEVKRYFTAEKVAPLSTLEWGRRDAVLVGADGVERFRQNDVEVPAYWSDTTTNIVAEKYFRIVDGVRENSAKQMFKRVARWVTDKGIGQGILSLKTAPVFYDELLHMLAHGMYAFNSPVWFNAGSKEDPQCSACFIQSVDDSMSSIMDLAKREVMLFKGGSGTGGNLSPLRSSWEKLSDGGFSSGPVSFMKGFDAFAGVTKSGGGTRRAAKMQVLNVDHPDILVQRNGQVGFIGCKQEAEQLAQDLYSTGKYSAEWNVPGNVYDLVGYQNANNSVRVTDGFMYAVTNDDSWYTELKDGSVHRTYKATEIWDAIAEAAWVCGCPGIQFDTATNDWHTCPNSGRIHASNPCSEYLFLNETACNLGSLNLRKFAKGPEGFDVPGFKQAVCIAITAKEIIVDGASYPSPTLARNSNKFRTLGLGYTNLGALLTYWGLGYDTEEGRNTAAAITALMGGEAYAQSARLAAAVGPFSEFEVNRKPMMSVIGKHLDHASTVPTMLGMPPINSHIWEEANNSWTDAFILGTKWGFRNAQTTVMAPTGTISFLMGCDTTGVEPMLGVVIYKKIVGEGLLRLPNSTIEPALENLGYDTDAVESILAHIVETGDIHTAEDFLSEHGPIFAEALGDHALPPQAHIDMMAAIQPFLSGGISKTVNVPSSATKQEIADLYMSAWKKGLKCVAIFRDGCKLSQPIATKLDHKEKAKTELKWGERRKLLDTRDSKTHKFIVGGLEGYLISGVYSTGELGEIFLRVSKEGSFLGGIVDSFATALSYALQYGAPPKELVAKFKDVRFEPSGYTGHPEIVIAKSLVDYIVRWLELTYLKDDESAEETVERDPGTSGTIDLHGSYDGAPCTKCGGLTKRAGACYVCTACGESTGCG